MSKNGKDVKYIKLSNCVLKHDYLTIKLTKVANLLLTLQLILKTAILTQMRACEVYCPMEVSFGHQMAQETKNHGGEGGEGGGGEDKLPPPQVHD